MRVRLEGLAALRGPAAREAVAVARDAVLGPAARGPAPAEDGADVRDAGEGYGDGGLEGREEGCYDALFGHVGEVEAREGDLAVDGDAAGTKDRVSRGYQRV